MKSVDSAYDLENHLLISITFSMINYFPSLAGKDYEDNISLFVKTSVPVLAIQRISRKRILGYFAKIRCRAIAKTLISQ